MAHSKNNACYVYLLRAEDALGYVYKIGISDSPTNRFRSIRSSVGGDVVLIFSWKMKDRDDALYVEKKSHEAFEEYRTQARVGIGNGHTEWFRLPDIKVKYLITTLCLIYYADEMYTDSQKETLRDLLAESDADNDTDDDALCGDNTTYRAISPQTFSSFDDQLWQGYPI